jgi:transcriptional regulator with XRE-family HTH domain
MNTIQQVIGANLKQCRKQRNLTQEQLAERSERSVESISAFERGRLTPSVETLLLLAGALRVSPMRLLQGTFEGDTAKDSHEESVVSPELKIIYSQLHEELRAQLVMFGRFLLFSQSSQDKT